MGNITLGPTGGDGGKEFAIYSIPADAKLREIHVYALGFVDAIQLKYEINGDVSELPRIGGHSGLHHAFVLDADEYLVGISGRSGHYIDSIRFHTNKRTSDSFGGWGGTTEFNFQAPAGGEVAGLFGRADWYIDALGVLIRDRQETPVAAAKPKAKAPAKAAPAPAATPAAEPAPKKKAPAAKAATVAAVAAPEAKKAPAKPAAKAAKVEAAASQEPAASAAKASAEPKAKPAAKAAKASAPAAETRAKTVDLAVAKTPKPEDLIKVEGIGPKIAGILIENDILDLSDLAATPVEKLRAILGAAGSRYKLADPATWPQQAALGAVGDWAAFDALQKSLKAGRKE